MSRFVDAVLGIVYGLDPPEVLDTLPGFLKECIEERRSREASYNKE